MPRTSALLPDAPEPADVPADADPVADEPGHAAADVDDAEIDRRHGEGVEIVCRCLARINPPPPTRYGRRPYPATRRGTATTRLPVRVVTLLPQHQVCAGLEESRERASKSPSTPKISPSRTPLTPNTTCVLSAALSRSTSVVSPPNVSADERLDLPLGRGRQPAAPTYSAATSSPMRPARAPPAPTGRTAPGTAARTATA